MLELFTTAFISFFVVIDPPGCAPIFGGLTRNASIAERRTMAIRSVLIATAILLFFAVAGEALLDALGIGLDAFRIAGGIMLFLIAMEMVFERRTQVRQDRAHEIMKSPEPEDVSVFPMAMPMIAGPGSIATVMLLTARANGPGESAIVLGALAANLVLMLLALLMAGPIMRVLGQKVEAVLTRLLAVVLAALAVQFVIDGVKGSIL